MYFCHKNVDMKIALLVLYNHRYDKNIPRIEKLYEGKFSHIFHLMPFYDGDHPNVFPVYESSYYFQSYIAQAYQHIKRMGFTHYFIVADDMILNPAINEDNLFEQTGILEDACYINSIEIISGGKEPWTFKYNAYLYNPVQRGVEIENIIPSYSTAMSILNQRGYYPKNLSFMEVLRDGFWALTHKRKRILFQTIRTFFAHKKLKYPLVGAWSDILLLTDDMMPKFCKYCGAFAATNLFVEIAIPTALLLSTDRFVTTKDIKLKNNIPLITSWTSKQQEEFYQKYNYKLDVLMDDYPKDRFFVHPIKLSQWK